MVIEDIDSIDDMRIVEDLQKEVWTLSDRDITPLTQLIAIRHAGGQLIGARDGGALVGFVYGFVAVERGRTTHHSHMLAVKPAYRGSDVGYQLKLAQRERVLAQGITRITWTFDPLQSLNAHFNTRKLGVVSDAYKINFYGAETSSVLHRIGTDRLWVTWLLDSERVQQRLEGKSVTGEVDPDATPLVVADAEGWPRELAFEEALARTQTFIEIPSDINSVQQQNPEQAMLWRDVTRRAFTEAFAAGFHVEDFFRQSRGGQSVGVYVLSQAGTREDLQ
ncbi:MAG TPA: GNAT family N-acetyltransferase [Thermoanaerobaculia bacterium]|jgi:predicted GNAT superfamily acetyltransferase|nr:GNAT family N-acetyltransferase [Thermoanaerobaculia bacterium]